MHLCRQRIPDAYSRRLFLILFRCQWDRSILYRLGVWKGRSTLVTLVETLCCNMSKSGPMKKRTELVFFTYILHIYLPTDNRSFESFFSLVNRSDFKVNFAWKVNFLRSYRNRKVRLTIESERWEAEKKSRLRLVASRRVGDNARWLY